MFQTGAEKFEHLHLILDTANGILSLLLAMFLLAEQSRIASNVRKYLVIGFGVAAATEILHALVGIEWSGWMAWASESSNVIRPATWPPSAYVLPLALAWIYSLIRRRAALRPALFAAGVMLITLILYFLSFNLPKYMDIGILGIQRPTQIPLLFLLLWVSAGYWRERRTHPLFEGIALMGVVLFLSDLCMLFSTSPHEKFTMMAHSGKFFAYTLLHTIQMRVAATDSRARSAAEAALVREEEHLRLALDELRGHRDNLEGLVQQRTAALLATEARAGHILQSSADGLVGIDKNGRITFINPAACSILGYRADEMVGSFAHAIFHHSKADGTPYAAEQCPGHLALKTGQQVRVDDEVYWHRDGYPIPVMYAMHPLVEEGEVTGGVISFVDISVQKSAAQARERALVAAEDLARMRSEFLSNMSHEIRTPLNGVMGFAEIGFRHYQNSDKALNAFTKIRESGTRLLGVVNEILDFSKIEAGKMRIEQVPINLHEVLNQSVDLLREQAKARQINLSLEMAPDLPVACMGDSLRLGQILLNLLSNAVKFTEAGSVVLAAEVAGDELVFRVSDTGIGMSPEQMTHLFNPFQQVDSSVTRRFGGTGLGLAICKRLVELMAGSIRVDSKPGVGSVFAFRVPYRSSEIQPARQDRGLALLKED